MHDDGRPAGAVGSGLSAGRIYVRLSYCLMAVIMVTAAMVEFFFLPARLKAAPPDWWIIYASFIPLLVLLPGYALVGFRRIRRAINVRSSGALINIYSYWMPVPVNDDDIDNRRRPNANSHTQLALASGVVLLVYLRLAWAGEPAAEGCDMIWRASNTVLWAILNVGLVRLFAAIERMSTDTDESAGAQLGRVVRTLLNPRDLPLGTLLIGVAAAIAVLEALRWASCVE